jgi:hypothetical protein
MVEVAASGYTALEMDAQVVIPLMLALNQSIWADVVGAVSGRERCALFLRTPILIPTLNEVNKAVGAIRLPDGSDVPIFSLAPPDNVPAERAVIEVDLARLDSLGVPTQRLVRAIRNRVRTLGPEVLRQLPDLEIDRQGDTPVRLRDIATLAVEPNPLAAQECFDWVVRVTDDDSESLGRALDTLAGTLRRQGGHRMDLQPTPAVSLALVPELDNARLAAKEVSVPAVREALAHALGHEVVYKTLLRPLVLRLPPSPPDRLARLTVDATTGEPVPLTAVARITAASLPETILRLSPDRLVGYLKGTGYPDSRLSDQVEAAGIPGAQIIRRIDLPVEDQALLGWPTVSPGPCPIVQ